ncbi:MAG: radical SAM protein [Clostridia bacterium]|nr:radical SAM protein [Clostridia bacterium]
MMSQHPCFNKEAHRVYGRIHLPVAPECNISCGFCDRKFSCANESRPGVTASVLSPEEAVEKAVRQAALHPELKVIGIAGPGDPLANPEKTLGTLRLVREHLPDMLLCLSSNGLALPGLADDIADLGVTHMTVTVNAVSPAVGAHIYRHVRLDGKTLSGEDAAAAILARQEEGVRKLKARSVTVKINMVIVPGVNDAHAEDVARAVKSWGADLMNCMPLMPVAGTPLESCGSPSPESMAAIRTTAEAYLPQMRHCTRCRADACGLLGQPGILG